MKDGVDPRIQSFVIRRSKASLTLVGWSHVRNAVQVLGEAQHPQCPRLATALLHPEHNVTGKRCRQSSELGE
jgi:hypothetical protein